ncbi:MAG: ACT domain-containing protein [Clostridia bacterium]|nr:ACT domain-containing protein [Oscillospiraceae bacterium]MBQ7033536.1 ACT domain-containing protein [Clostridia bacterium]
MKAIITVLGCDRVGIIADVTAALARNNINILDISQTIMQDIFTMIMLADISGSRKTLAEIEEEMEAVGKNLGVSVTVQHADLFNSMHRI